MLENIKYFIQLCFFKVSPEVLRYSRPMLYVLVGLNVFNAYNSYVSQLPVDSGRVAVACGLSMLFSILVLWGLLAFRKMTERFHKIFMATLGIELFFVALMTLIVKGAGAMNLAGIFYLAFLIWALSVKTFIFYKGFNTRPLWAFWMVILYEMVGNLPISIEILPAIQNMQP